MLLGGEIKLKSDRGKGSTFTLFLPQSYVAAASSSAAEGSYPRVVNVMQPPLTLQIERPVEEVEDDRHQLELNDTILLIVEDDPHYARTLRDIAQANGFKVLVALRGADALALVREFKPTAVSLDVFLPDMLGWTVLNHLKQDPDLRHIPVQVLTVDGDRPHGLSRGAFSFLIKPSTEDE